jgi:hypothetical protein
MPPTLFGFRACLAAALAIVFVAGCKTTPPPDPNDPSQVGMVQPDVLMRNLRWASEALNQRVAKGEIPDARAQIMLSEYAADLTKHIELSRITEDLAWEYAEVFRTARQWENARIVFEIALRNPKGEDRRVNDTLRHAQVLAQLDRVPDALSTARRVFDAAPKDRAPLIPSLIFELTPAARGKGYDVELAELIQDAIPLYEATVVDPTSEAGKSFLRAKPYLLREARKLIAELLAGVNLRQNG